MFDIQLVAKNISKHLVIHSVTNMFFLGEYWLFLSFKIQDYSKDIDYS